MNDRRDTALMTNHLGEKALHLRIVEEFLTQLELLLLKTRSNPFDFEKVKLGLAELKDPTLGDATERRKRVEFQLAHELVLWQENLEGRDSDIEAYHIRRYCDGLKKPLDSEVFIALTRFYRNMPRSRNSLSKFDLAITRAFSYAANDLERTLTLTGGQLGARIEELFTRWDRAPSEQKGWQHDAAMFDRFIEEATSIGDFQLLTSQNLFDRIRDFKAELGDRFYDHHVAASAIECNVAVGNRLNELMARASESLGERLGAEFDFGGAFQDTSPNAGTYISEVLRQIDAKDSLINADSESEDLRFLRSLLELTDTVREKVETEDSGSILEPVAEVVLSVETQNFRKLLEFLQQHNPPTGEIRRHLDSSEALQGIDLTDFLFGEDDLPDELSREVLSLILSLEELRANELNERKELAPYVRESVLALLKAAERLGTKLEKASSAANASVGRRLTVANKLLEARLRTERSIVKFSSRGLEHAIAHEPELVETPIELGSTLSYIDIGSFGANRWIVGATVASALLTGFLYFSTGNVAASLSDDVEVLEPSRLPGGKELTGAHRQGSTLYVVANENWRGRSSEVKTEALKELVESPSTVKLDSVVVIDDQGQPIADLSPAGVNINNESRTFDVEGLR